MGCFGGVFGAVHKAIVGVGSREGWRDGAWQSWQAAAHDVSGC